MQCYFSDGLNVNPNHDTIYVFGSGVSQDLFFLTDESKGLSRRKAIIITANGAISLMKPNIQVSGDTWAIEDWCQHKNNDKKVVWIAPQHSIETIISRKLRFVRSADLFKRSWAGSGAEAMYVTYNIWKFYDIKRIVYIGFDFGELIIEEREYVYSRRAQVRHDQHHIQAPVKWWEKDCVMRKYDHRAYNFQIMAFAHFQHDKEFLDVLDCRSFIDISKLDDQCADAGYSKAFSTEWLTNLI